MTWLTSYNMITGQIYIFFIIIGFLVCPTRLPAMTSAWCLKDTLRGKTQNFLIPKFTIDLFTTHQLQLHRQLSDFHPSNATGETSKRQPPNNVGQLTFVYIITSWSHFVDLSSSNFSSSLINFSEEPKYLSGYLNHRLGRFLCGALIRRR